MPGHFLFLIALVGILSPACRKKSFVQFPLLYTLIQQNTFSTQVVSFAFSDNIHRLNIKHVLECFAGSGPALLELHIKSARMLFWKFHNSIVPIVHCT